MVAEQLPWSRPGGRAGIVLSSVVTIFAVTASAQIGPDTRSAWHYTTTVEGRPITVTLVRQAEAAAVWKAIRSDGREESYDEVARTSAYVELKNRRTNLEIRLHAEYAQWRRPQDADWKRWVAGRWVQPPAEARGPTTKEKPVVKPPIVRPPVVRPPVVRPPVVPPASAAPRTPSSSGRTVKLAYFVPKDRRPVRDYAERIRVVAAIVSELYRDGLARHGYATPGIPFAPLGGVPAVQLVAGERDAAYYNNAPQYDADEQWKRLLPEIVAQVGKPRENLILVFAETWDERPAEYGWPGGIARGAYFTADGGLGVVSAHLIADGFGAATLAEQRKLLFDETPIADRRMQGHRRPTPRAEFVEDGIGAAAHELGHAFGLPHDMRNDAVYLMGNGFRNLRRNFSESGEKVGFSPDDVRLLSASRFFARDVDLSDNQGATASLRVAERGPEELTVIFTAADDTGLRAVAYFDKTAGTLVGGRALGGKRQEFRERLPAKTAKGEPVKLQAIVVDQGGNQTRVDAND